MIRFLVSRAGGHYTGFTCEGHAGYAEAGEDIVCAAVSALTVNAVNSIEAFTEDAFELEQSENGGYLKLRITERPSESAELLLDSLVLGIKNILEEYGDVYVSIDFQEEDAGGADFDS